MNAASNMTGAPEPTAHPAAELFPMLSDEALEPIVESMKVIGFDPLTPILRYRGQILDGRNRFRAAALANVEPLFLDVPDSVDPYLESWKYNGNRRDLSQGAKAAIMAKIQFASVEWQNARHDRQKAANAARAEKAKAQHATSNPRVGEKSGRASSEAEPKTDAHATASALAAKAGVSRPTMERALRLAKHEPEKLEAVIRGEKPERKKRGPRIDRTQRNEDVLRLHQDGLGTREIAKRLNLHPSSVSESKAHLGVDVASSRLWDDIDHITTALEGVCLKAEQLTEQLKEGDIAAETKEIHRCIKSLSRSTLTVKQLRNALKQRCP